MKDIKLLCLVLVIGGLMGAVVNRAANHPDTITVTHPTGGGFVNLFTSEKGQAAIFLWSPKNANTAGGDPSTSLVVDNNGSMLTMKDSQNRKRLVMGVGENGLTMLVMLDSQGKKIWGAIASPNGKVTTIGH